MGAGEVWLSRGRGLVWAVSYVIVPELAMPRCTAPHKRIMTLSVQEATSHDYCLGVRHCSVDAAGQKSSTQAIGARVANPRGGIDKREETRPGELGGTACFAGEDKSMMGRFSGFLARGVWEVEVEVAPSESMYILYYCIVVFSFSFHAARVDICSLHRLQVHRYMKYIRPVHGEWRTHVAHRQHRRLFESCATGAL